MAFIIALVGTLVLLLTITAYAIRARGHRGDQPSTDVRDRRPMLRLEALRKPA